jgi:hypothetical protein
MLNLDSIVNMDIYNNLVKIKGGSPIITKKKLVSMKSFITVILKLFRKDYESKLKKYKGGYFDSISDLGIFNTALKYGDLNYSKSYEFPPVAQLERDVV